MAGVIYYLVESRKTLFIICEKIAAQSNCEFSGISWFRIPTLL